MHAPRPAVLQHLLHVVLWQSGCQLVSTWWDNDRHGSCILLRQVNQTATNAYARFIVTSKNFPTDLQGDLTPARL
jgi:hypothetical protein